MVALAEEQLPHLSRFQIHRADSRQYIWLEAIMVGV